MGAAQPRAMMAANVRMGMICWQLDSNRNFNYILMLY
jgi:hypothetical protein